MRPDQSIQTRRTWRRTIVSLEYGIYTVYDPKKKQNIKKFGCQLSDLLVEDREKRL